MNEPSNWKVTLLRRKIKGSALAPSCARGALQLFSQSRSAPYLHSIATLRLRIRRAHRPAQPLDGLFQAFNFFRRRCRWKGLRKNMFMKLRNSLEQRVGHHSYIRPHARQKCARAAHRALRKDGWLPLQGPLRNPFEVSGWSANHLHLSSSVSRRKPSGAEHVRSYSSALRIGISLPQIRQSGKSRRPCPKLCRRSRVLGDLA